MVHIPFAIGELGLTFGLEHCFADQLESKYNYYSKHQKFITRKGNLFFHILAFGALSAQSKFEMQFSDSETILVPVGFHIALKKKEKFKLRI